MLSDHLVPKDSRRRERRRNSRSPSWWPSCSGYSMEMEPVHNSTRKSGLWNMAFPERGHTCFRKENRSSCVEHGDESTSAGLCSLFIPRGFVHRSFDLLNIEHNDHNELLQKWFPFHRFYSQFISIPCFTGPAHSESTRPAPQSSGRGPRGRAPGHRPVAVCGAGTRHRCRSRKGAVRAQSRHGGSG